MIPGVWWLYHGHWDRVASEINTGLSGHVCHVSSDLLATHPRFMVTFVLQPTLCFTSFYLTHFIMWVPEKVLFSFKWTKVSIIFAFLCSAKNSGEHKIIDSPAHNFFICSRILFYRNDHHIEMSCRAQYLGRYPEGQGHSMTLQQNCVWPVTLLFKIGF